jgi:predicted DNA-binding WGR domain protein
MTSMEVWLTESPVEATLASLCIALEARSPARRCFRAYEIAAGVDLFGAWRVDMSYGRIGTRGRTKTRSFPTAAAAQAQVVACLKRRASAPRRIGVGYQVVRHGGLGRSDLEDRLRPWFGTAEHGQAPTRST